jgi:glycopeptide antibiotics resistance protein
MRSASTLPLSVAVILLIAFPWYSFQGHAHWGHVRWIPFVSPPVSLRDMVLNVLLFMPFGAALTHRLRGWRPAPVIAVAAALALALSAETAQVYSHGRIPSTTDLITNVAGAGAGAILARRRSTRVALA